MIVRVDLSKDEAQLVKDALSRLRQSRVPDYRLYEAIDRIMMKINLAACEQK